MHNLCFKLINLIKRAQRVLEQVALLETMIQKEERRRTMPRIIWKKERRKLKSRYL